MRRTALILALAAAGSACCAAVAAAAGPVDRVDPLAGTRPGPATFGGGHEFPGAALPFGMVQWSPDTTPAFRNGRGGYDYRDHHLRGFSLTHLNGAGCSLYGDFPFLPTTEPISSSPAAPEGGLDGRFQPGFSHRGESARPGYYSVRLNPVRGGAIAAQLTATTRTGVARFVFPADPHSSVLVDAGGSAQPDDFAAVRIDPSRREIDGAASSGLFCGQRPRYRVYFAAVFNRPFGSYGTWTGGSLAPGATAAEATSLPSADPKTTAAAGAYASFDTRRRRLVEVHVGVSFVSVAGARANLAAESRRLSFASVAARARAAWERALGHVRVRGGTPALLDTFYTALYHVFLAPRTFSDADGRYAGMDGQVHTAQGRLQYADFSGWDTYRTEMPLLSMLVPGRASQMIRSLLADAAQSGCLPRWPYASGQSMTMVGDPADPIIASAFAFGARSFDLRAALAAMVAGASRPCESPNGEYLERQGLAAYLSHGYVPFDLDARVRNANSIFGSPDAVWGSAATTLEYQVDDFAIAQLAARALSDRSTYRAFMLRSARWRRLFDPASGLIEPRYASGAFPSPYDPLGGSGFVEGDAPQYSWMVPQDPAGLFRRMGGPASAARRLARFVRSLNAGPGGAHTDHALLGNEPTLHAPWLFDWARRPDLTQITVRRGLLGLYRAAPDGWPGNDDLGTLSAWYVFGALGLYPEVPGVGVLAIGSPLFPRASISTGGRARTVVEASGRGPYVRGLRIDGRAHDRPWTTYCALAGGAHLAFSLGRRPRRAWGSAAAAAPPSYGPRRPMPANACAP